MKTIHLHQSKKEEIEERIAMSVVITWRNIFLLKMVAITIIIFENNFWMNLSSLVSSQSDWTSGIFCNTLSISESEKWIKRNAVIRRVLALVTIKKVRLTYFEENITCSTTHTINQPNVNIGTNDHSGLSMYVIVLFKHQQKKPNIQMS